MIRNRSCRIYNRPLLHVAVALCLLCQAWGASSAAAQAVVRLKSPKTGPIITVQQYRSELQRSLQTLHGWQRKGPRPTLNQAEAALPPSDDRTVRAANGRLQKVNGYEWNREFSKGFNSWGTTKKTKITRNQLRQLSTMLDSRLKALTEWERDSSAPANAQTIAKALEANGEVRAKPTQFQQYWYDTKESITKFLDNLFRRTAPTPRRIRPWNVNTQWLQFFFVSTLLTLVLVVAWWLWKTLGGRWQHDPARRNVRFEGEDQELFALPPEELRDRADVLASEGKYEEALRHRFISLLVTFDERGVWRYDLRRTNWEHITALRKKPHTQPLVKPLSDITRRFDRVRYGNARCSAADWSQFAADVATLEAMPSAQSASTGASPRTPAAPLGGITA